MQPFVNCLSNVENTNTLTVSPDESNKKKEDHKISDLKLVAIRLHFVRRSLAYCCCLCWFVTVVEQHVLPFLSTVHWKAVSCLLREVRRLQLPQESRQCAVAAQSRPERDAQVLRWRRTGLFPSTGAQQVHLRRLGAKSCASLGLPLRWPLHVSRIRRLHGELHYRNSDKS